ncbi:bifunctional 3-dehydroquinate dehydratase/shikimate dehydrogenase, chloroplastic-like [Durio zibethinus]|uniref:Bifunctional 3-dehydroquinate dehydratase/shikimate dehydrogenase, chloroplastic-like n=1 Tax=Durio zibethinus TaxID=66656 RepID=A0A6P5WTV5_DURZI|nr:bifunctional 3-dehydroquinate dehydratase/shikimate dehydrogenase, chloroplastic-like [Durio zibethinus]
MRHTGPDTKVHGVIGNPISHSKSSHLYNTAFRSTGFNGIYLPLLADDVSKFITTYSSPDFAGIVENLICNMFLAGHLCV